MAICRECKHFEECDELAAIYIGDLPACKDFEEWEKKQ
jgi:hypothetical protein